MKETVLFLAVYIGLKTTSWPELAHIKDRQEREM